MRLRHTLILATSIVLPVGSVCFAADKTTYEDHLLPILRNECASCHNPDKKKGGLDLSSYQAILAGSDSGAVVQAGDPDSSKLYKVVAHADDPYMPKGKGKLQDKDVNVFKQWIAGGMLENAGGKAVVAKGKPKLNLSVVADAGKPKGTVAMPKELLVEPVVHTSRPGALMCLAASPWAPLVAIGGQHQVLLYNTDTLELLGILPFPEGDPYVLSFSRNGSMLLVGGGVSAKSGHVALFDVASGNRVTQVGDEFDAVIAADLSPDQSMVGLGGPGKTVKIYSTADAQLLHAMKKHTDWVTAIAYAPDGVLLASGDRAGGLWVWEARSGNEFYGLTGHKAAITAVSFRGDSNILASASEDGTVKLWDMQSGNLLKNINAHGPGVLDASFTHDGRLVTCGRDRLVRIWKPDGSALLATQPFNDIALHATFDGDGRRIVAGDWTGAIRVFDAKTAKSVGELSANPAGIEKRLADASKQLSEAQGNYAKLAAALDQATRQLNDARARVSEL
jgi:WD40 repeat protein